MPRCSCKTLRGSLTRRIVRSPAAAYFILLFAAFAFGAAALAAFAGSAGLATGLVAWLVVLAAFPLSEVAVQLVALGLRHLVPARSRPTLRFDQGVPEACRTLFVVPAMLGDLPGVERLVADFERHYRMHRAPNVHFALLTDFEDAPAAAVPQDAELLRRTAELVARIEVAQGSSDASRVLLLHRRRQWNAAQSAWMGWERKRGKLEELTRLLRGDRSTSFSETVGTIDALGRVQFVITVDEDCRVPSGAVRALIEMLAHPSHRPVVDRLARRVVRGHGVLQPLMRATRRAAGATRFASLSTRCGGLHPDVREGSDIYPDVFGFGRYVGKGIYDVDAFLAVACRRVPDNHLLSHDLFEGCLLRAGTADGIEVRESFPSRYSAFMQRQHRWTRGDWQVLPWLLPGAWSAHERLDDIRGVGRWILIDTIRASLAAGGAFCLFVAAAFVDHDEARVFVATGVLALAAPIAAQYVRASAWPSRSRCRDGAAQRVAPPRAYLAFFVLSCVLLPEAARMSIDAIVRTLVRLCATRRNLLEWKTSRRVDLESERQSILAVAGRFWFAPAIASALIACLSVAGARWDHPGLPVYLSWLLAPWTAAWVSKPSAAAGHGDLDDWA